jgi:hypothetical protein
VWQRPLGVVLLVALCWLGPLGATAADRFFAYNLTTSTDFVGVFLAPAGTLAWGVNQALNDRDKALDPGERLAITGISRGRFDVKLQDRQGRICIKHGIVLTTDTTFDIRDSDLADCR